MTVGGGLRVGLSFVLSAVALSAHAAEWSFSGGVSRRHIQTSFDVSAPSWDGIAHSYTPRQAVGDNFLVGEDRVGEIVGTANHPPFAVYADGRLMLGDEFWLNWAGARAVIDSPSQIGIDPSAHSYVGTVRTLNFHSYEYAYATQVVAGDTHSLDGDTVLSPYLSLQYGGWSVAGGEVSIGLRYTLMSKDMASGSHVLSTRLDEETQTTHTFIYDVGEAPLAEFRSNPFFFPKDEWLVIYDASVFNRFPAAQYTHEHLNDPREETSSVTRVVETLAFDGSSMVKLHLHEIALSAKWAKALGSRLHLGLEAGPTLNVFRTEMMSTVNLVNPDSGTLLDSQTADSGKTTLKIGAMANATGTLFLDKRGHVRVEAAWGFHWVDHVALSLASSAASVRTGDNVLTVGLGVGL